MYPPLELLESGRLALRVERNDLAVEDERRFPGMCPLCERCGDLGKLSRFLVAQTRPEVYGSLRRDLDDRADAVVLGLVDEMRIGEWRVDERREHRAEVEDHG